jgi:hypothetical protein
VYSMFAFIAGVYSMCAFIAGVYSMCAFIVRSVRFVSFRIIYDSLESDYFLNDFRK